MSCVVLCSCLFWRWIDIPSLHYLERFRNFLYFLLLCQVTNLFFHRKRRQSPYLFQIVAYDEVCAYLLWFVCPRGPFPPALSRTTRPPDFPCSARTRASRLPVACPVGREPPYVRCRQGRNLVRWSVVVRQWPDILGIIALFRLVLP